MPTVQTQSRDPRGKSFTQDHPAGVKVKAQIQVPSLTHSVICSPILVTRSSVTVSELFKPPWASDMCVETGNILYYEYETRLVILRKTVQGSEQDHSCKVCGAGPSKS